MPHRGEFEFAGTPRFEIRRRIGAGGMGAVYEAFDRDNQATVALKTLRRGSPQELYRLKREFRSLQDLQHRNLVGLGELVEEAGQWFFTMELIDGVDFLSYVRQGAAVSVTDSDLVGANADTVDLHRAVLASPEITGASFDEPRLRAASSQLGLALHVLHQAGKIHRDVKPSNVLVTEDGRVVLLDFGLVADRTGGSDSSEMNVVGTADYMAPEQAVAGEVGAAADWYAFGAVLYEALTGRPPYVGKTSLQVLMAKQQYAPPPPRAIVPDVPRDLDDLCADLLAINPTERPAGALVLSRLGVAVGVVRSAAASTTSQFTQRLPFLGREHELGELRRAFEDSQKGEAVTVVVSGQSGRGKTALIREFADSITMERSDTLVLTGRCYEQESVPYKALDGVVDALSRHMVRLPDREAAELLPPDAALLSRVFPVLARVEAIGQAPKPRKTVTDPHEIRRRAFEALKGLLHLLAERRTVIVIIDDLQWADPDSLALLRELTQPPAPPPMLLLVSRRSEDRRLGAASTYADLRDVLVGDVRNVEVGTLDRDAACALADYLLRSSSSSVEHRAQEIAVEAEGHPLFIQELVHHATELGRPVERLRLEEAIWMRVENLPAAARQIMELVAVAGTPLPRDVVRHAAKLEYPEFRKHVSLLRLASLVRTSGLRGSDHIEPYHDRVRESVIEYLDEGTRVARHQRLAVGLESSSSLVAERPELLLKHLEASGQAERAVNYAEEAARRALNALAFDRAAEFLGAALRLHPHDEDAERELRLLLGDALSNAGRGAEAAEVLTIAAEGADSTTRLECHRRAAEQLLISGHIVDGLTALTALLGEIGVEMPRTPRRALISLLWYRFKIRIGGVRWKERHDKEIASSDLTRLDVYKAATIGLNMVDTIRGADFQARLLFYALRAGEPRRIGRALAHEACYLSTQGQRSRARALRLIERGTAIAERTRDAYLDAWLVTARGLNEYFSGKFQTAVETLANAQEVFRDRTVGWTWELATVRIFHLFALRHTGNVGELGRLAREYVRDAHRRGDRYSETSIRRTRHSAWLALGEPDKAHEELERALWTPPEGGFHLQHWYEIEARAELALYEGNAAEAAEELASSFDLLDRSLLLRVSMVRTVTFGVRGRLAVAIAKNAEDPSAAHRQALRFARRLEREDTEYQKGWASLIKAAVYAQTDRGEQAVSELARAEEISEAAGMSGCAAAAAWRKGELLGGVEGDALVSRARQRLRGHGVVDIARHLDIIAPGF